MHDDAVKMLRSIGAIVNVFQHERETAHEFAGRVGKHVTDLRNEHSHTASIIGVVRHALQQAATEQFLGNDKLARECIADAYRTVLK